MGRRRLYHFGNRVQLRMADLCLPHFRFSDPQFASPHQGLCLLGATSNLRRICGPLPLRNVACLRADGYGDRFRCGYTVEAV